MDDEATSIALGHACFSFGECLGWTESGSGLGLKPCGSECECCMHAFFAVHNVFWN
jgi:hypothetical protein